MRLEQEKVLVLQKHFRAKLARIQAAKVRKQYEVLLKLTVSAERRAVMKLEVRASRSRAIGCPRPSPRAPVLRAGRAPSPALSLPALSLPCGRSALLSARRELHPPPLPASYAQPVQMARQTARARTPTRPAPTRSSLRPPTVSQPRPPAACSWRTSSAGSGGERLPPRSLELTTLVAGCVARACAPRAARIAVRATAVGCVLACGRGCAGQEAVAVGPVDASTTRPPDVRMDPFEAATRVHMGPLLSEGRPANQIRAMRPAGVVALAEGGRLAIVRPGFGARGLGLSGLCLLSPRLGALAPSTLTRGLSVLRWRALLPLAPRARARLSRRRGWSARRS
jgi:hypothetical protein